MRDTYADPPVPTVRVGSHPSHIVGATVVLLNVSRHWGPKAWRVIERAARTIFREASARYIFG